MRVLFLCATKQINPEAILEDSVSCGEYQKRLLK